MSTFGLHTHAQVVRFVGRSKLTQRSASDTQMGSLRHGRASGYILLSRIETLILVERDQCCLPCKSVPL